MRLKRLEISFYTIPLYDENTDISWEAFEHIRFYLRLIVRAVSGDQSSWIYSRTKPFSIGSYAN